MKKLVTVFCGALLMVACALTSASAGTVAGSLADVLHTKGVLDDAAYNDIKNAGSDQAVEKKLLDVLHTKGVLDDATYGKLSEQAAAPVAVPSPQASAAPADRPLDKVLASVEDGFAKLNVGDAKLKIGTWTQFGFATDSRNVLSVPLEGSSGMTASNSSFFTRFARLYLNGQFTDKIGYRLMYEFNGSTLRDVYVWFDYIPYTRVTVGQFLTPFGDETWRAPFDLPMINYSLAATSMQFVNFRDYGIMATIKNSKKLDNGLTLGGGISTAVVNGNSGASALNAIDDFGSKDWIGRAWVNPLVPGLSVGGSWYVGKTRPVVKPTAATAKQMVKEWDRYGLEMDYAPPFAKGLALRGEYLYEHKWRNTTAAGTLSPRYVDGSGWYVQGAYRMNAVKSLSNFEPTFRYEKFDEDRTVKGDMRTRTTFGLNYWITKYMRLLNNVEIIQAGKNVNPNLNPNMGVDTAVGSVARNSRNHELFTTNLQIWF